MSGPLHFQKKFYSHYQYFVGLFNSFLSTYLSLLKLISIYAVVNGLAGCAYFKFSRGVESIDVLDVLDMALGDFFGAILFLIVIVFFKEPIKASFRSVNKK